MSVKIVCIHFFWRNAPAGGDWGDDSPSAPRKRCLRGSLLEKVWNKNANSSEFFSQNSEFSANFWFVIRDLFVHPLFHIFSRNDVSGQCLRGAEGESSPQSPPAGAFLLKKKEKGEKKERMSPARWGHPGGCPPAWAARNVISAKKEWKRKWTRSSLS